MHALLELQYLPPVQYLHKFTQYHIVIEAQENYKKGSYRNRCMIASANGPLRLSVPLLKGKHQQSPIREVEVDNRRDWQRIHWQSIRSAYGRAPFFEFYADAFHDLYQQSFQYLWDWNWALLQELLQALQLPLPSFTEEYAKVLPPGTLDFRDRISPKKDYVLDHTFRPQPYPQVFEDRHEFLPNLSALDLLFCAGPEARRYL